MRVFPITVAFAVVLARSDGVVSFSVSLPSLLLWATSIASLV